MAEIPTLRDDSHNGLVPATSPPGTSLVLRVGIVGHRRDRLDQADPPILAEVLGSILLAIRESAQSFQKNHPLLFLQKPLSLRLISPLAEGADRMAAAKALELGYQLQSPMPYDQVEYEKDFTPASQTEFHHLIDRAGSPVRFELDGDRDNPAEAYGAAGRVVLNQSDILIAAWDGRWLGKRGGTEDLLRAALGYHVPVLWVDAKAPHAWCLLREPGDLPQNRGPAGAVPAGQEGMALIGTLVADILSPPAAGASARQGWRALIPQRLILFMRLFNAHDHSGSDLRKEYFAETKPPCNLAFGWKLFRDLLGENSLVLQRVTVEEIGGSLPQEWTQEVPEAAGWANSALRPHYAWADRLADYYADQYRSTFVLTFLLGVLAVTLALAPLPLEAGSGMQESWAKFCAVAELLVIMLILGMAGMDWGRRWHERWMDYRLVAELIRQVRILAPLGGGRPFSRVAPHLTAHGDPTNTWIYWHVRSLERQMGLPDLRLDQDQLRHTLSYLRAVQKGQHAFHLKNQSRSALINVRLHVVGYGAFLLTLVIVVTHVLPYFGLPRMPFIPEHGLSVAAAILPALGAAMAGINNQGEFGKVAKRSRGMSERLDKLGERLDRLEKLPAIHSREVVELATELTQLMVDEVSDWRLVFTDRGGIEV